jgi:hypothetical protein
MARIKLWARNGEAVRQALELGEIAHIETASEELTDEFLLFAIKSGLLKGWAASFPDPRCAPEIATVGLSYSLDQLFAHTQAGARLANKGIYAKRDSLLSIAYSEELISTTISATLQSTDRHHGIVGQKRCHFQGDS